MPFLRRKHVPSVCPKTGKYLLGNRKHRWVVWILPITGLLALVWFLIRVIPKPSRATYPCQRVAFPLASGFVAWLLGCIASAMVFRKAKLCFARGRYVVGIICIAVSIGFVWLAMSASGEKLVLAQPQPANQPIGVPRGTHPGRVVWVHDANATDWDGYDSPEHWFDSEHTDQEVVGKMLSQGIRGLAGESTDEAAWDAIFRHFNQSRGKGNVGYTPGEKVAIKVNHVLSGGADPNVMDKVENINYIDNSPQLTIALLRQLVNKAGVDPCDITVGDPSRIMPNYWYDMVHPHEPNVVCMGHYGGLGRTQAEFSDVEFYWSTANAGGKKQDYIPLSFAEAHYFINFAILKSHEGSGMTLCAKNLYGSLLRNPTGILWDMQYNYYNMHGSLPGFKPEMGHYRCMVDLMGHPELGGKTVLYIVDGLFAGQHWYSEPKKWEMQPFNGDWPSSLFVSQDPVAIDSVCFDFLWSEWSGYPHISAADDYLHEAALANDPCSETFYDPNDDGLGLASLGVHEHWNNSTDKQYSRNLGTGDGIELTSPVPPDFNGDGEFNFEDLMTLIDQWLQTSDSLSADIAPGPSGDGVVNMKDFALFARYWSP